MKYNLPQGKLKLQKLISHNEIDKALALCKLLVRNYQDADLLLTLAHIQLLSNEQKGCKRTRELINKTYPTNASIHRQLASIFKTHGHLQQAIEEYTISVENAPHDESLYHELAAIYIHTRQYGKAISFLKMAVIRFSGSSQLFLMLGATYQSIQDIDNALLCYEKAHELSVENVDAIVGIANIHYLHKNYDKARSILKPIIDTRPCSFPALILNSQLASSTDQKKTAIHKLTITPDSSISAIQQSMKYFSLGRLNDETANYEMAFEHYSKANKLIPNNYDQYSSDNYFTAIKESYTFDVINTLKRTTLDSKRLVFIVGMPRSGTSLLEQILASHPDVYGAGELNTLGDIVKNLPARHHLSLSFPDIISELTDISIEDAALQYIEHINSIDLKSRLVTDKMPDNFLYLGLINIMFPEAKIIHCTRNPYDTCISCYFQQFSGNYPYAYNLKNLGHYYNHYRTLMSHWNKTLTIPILEVKYEMLVYESRTTIKLLLEHCGIEWNDNCLSFEKSSRAVTTASTQQVSKPLYNTSINRWKHYQAVISPLFETLQDTP